MKDQVQQFKNAKMQLVRAGCDLETVLEKALTDLLKESGYEVFFVQGDGMIQANPAKDPTHISDTILASFVERAFPGYTDACDLVIGPECAVEVLPEGFVWPDAGYNPEEDYLLDE